MFFASFHQTGKMFSKIMKNLLLLLALLFIIRIEMTWANLQDQPCETYMKQGQKTLCHKLQAYEDRKDEYKLINAIGTLKMRYKEFPGFKYFFDNLIGYDEPLYPIPIGQSVYFLYFICIMFCWYITRAFRLFFEDTHKKFLLRPETAKVPVLPLYWLQQSQRELELTREVRNTWAWLAKKYILSPDDPLLEGMDDVMDNTTWEDFHVPKDTWSLVNVVLKLNQLYKEIKEGKGGHTTFNFKLNEIRELEAFKRELERAQRLEKTELAEKQAKIDAEKSRLEMLAGQSGDQTTNAEGTTDKEDTEGHDELGKEKLKPLHKITKHKRGQKGFVPKTHSLDDFSDEGLLEPKHKKRLGRSKKRSLEGHRLVGTQSDKSPLANRPLHQPNPQISPKLLLTSKKVKKHKAYVYQDHANHVSIFRGEEPKYTIKGRHHKHRKSLTTKPSEIHVRGDLRHPRNSIPLRTPLISIVPKRRPKVNKKNRKLSSRRKPRSFEEEDEDEDKEEDIFEEQAMPYHQAKPKNKRKKPRSWENDQFEDNNFQEKAMPYHQTKPKNKQKPRSWEYDQNKDNNFEEKVMPYNQTKPKNKQKPRSWEHDQNKDQSFEKAMPYHQPKPIKKSNKNKNKRDNNRMGSLPGGVTQYSEGDPFDENDSPHLFVYQDANGDIGFDLSRPSGRKYSTDKNYKLVVEEEAGGGVNLVLKDPNGQIIVNSNIELMPPGNNYHHPGQY